MAQILKRLDLRQARIGDIGAPYCQLLNLSDFKFCIPASVNDVWSALKFFSRVEPASQRKVFPEIALSPRPNSVNLGRIGICPTPISVTPAPVNNKPFQIVTRARVSDDPIAAAAHGNRI